MIQSIEIKIGDKIKALFQNFLDQTVCVNGIVRRVDAKEIVGNDQISGQSFFVTFDEILEVNNTPLLAAKILESLKEVS